jgi:hypothetical protein
MCEIFSWTTNYKHVDGAEFSGCVRQVKVNKVCAEVMRVISCQAIIQFNCLFIYVLTQTAQRPIMKQARPERQTKQTNKHTNKRQIKATCII